jgi:hypothetical protein
VKRQVYLWTIVAFRTGGGKVRWNTTSLVYLLVPGVRHSVHWSLEVYSGSQILTWPMETYLIQRPECLHKLVNNWTLSSISQVRRNMNRFEIIALQISFPLYHHMVCQSWISFWKYKFLSQKQFVSPTN